MHRHILALLLLIPSPSFANGSGALPCTNLQSVGRGLPFPSAAARVGLVDGDAVVTFTLGSDGRVLTPRVLSASDPSFADAAMEAVSALTCSAPLAEASPTLHIRFNRSILQSRSVRASWDATSLSSTSSYVCGLPEGGLRYAYPRAAFDLGITSGFVRVRATISPDLRVVQPRVQDATHDVFISSAIDIAGLFRCHGIGSSTAKTVDIPFNFKVE